MSRELRTVLSILCITYGCSECCLDLQLHSYILVHSTTQVQVFFVNMAQYDMFGKNNIVIYQ